MTKALITGASSGIGRELALLLADKGVELILHGRDEANLQEVFVEASKKTVAKIVRADLASFEGTQSVLQMLQGEFPDLVINNAGFGEYGDLISQSPQDVQRMIAANCAALVAISQHMAFWWKQEGIKGTILNVSSVLSLLPAPGAGVYGATKAFVNSFSEALDIELQPYGIRVLCSCPGRVATRFAQRASKGRYETLSPGGMVLDPKEVAQEIWDQIQNKEPLRIINWKYRLLVFLRKLFPKKIVLEKLYHSLKARSQ
jgi:uncharacterized protein